MSHERASKFKFNSDLSLEFLENVKEDIQRNMSHSDESWRQSAEDWQHSFQDYVDGNDDFREGFVEAILGITGYDLSNLLERLSL